MKLKKLKLFQNLKLTLHIKCCTTLPWPLDPRQSTSTSKISYTDGKMILFTQPANKSSFADDDAITMDNFFEKWIISQATNGEISIDVEGKMDLEGSIPSWMVNSFIPSELKKSYGEIINRSKK